MGTRDRIVSATTELFRAKGYQGTSLADVGAAAGAPTGSLYHFFPGGKSALAAVVLRDSGRAYLELFEAVAADTSGAPADVVAALFDGAAAVLEESGFIEICPIGRVAREMAGTDDAIRLATAEVFELWVTTLTGRLEHDGFPADDAADLAVTVIAALEGTFTLARSTRDADVVRATGRQLRRLVDAQVAAARA